MSFLSHRVRGEPVGEGGYSPESPPPPVAPPLRRARTPNTIGLVDFRENGTCDGKKYR